MNVLAGCVFVRSQFSESTFLFLSTRRMRPVRVSFVWDVYQLNFLGTSILVSSAVLLLGK